MRATIPSRLIEKKRRGDELTPEELEAFFLGFLAGEVPDYQMSAFLMAVHFQGLSPEELDRLLDLMLHSGEVLDFSEIRAPKVDKHSTGGVGDKTSLILAPVAAELGLCVPMMSGRGLGHTAGTLDKLDSIPGFRTQITLDEFRSVLSKVGLAMMGQTEEIAPLDGKLYALRDATATVPSIPLIAASIMSKKLAEGIQGLVLDVKTGEGAFLPDFEDSLKLARIMATLGEARGVRSTALVTRMDAPLGRAVGNGMETKEALTCLAGKGPEDLTELSSYLVGEMLFLGNGAATPDEGYQRARAALSSGAGVDRMARLIELQGGDPRVVEDPDRIPTAPEVGVLRAERNGFISQIVPTVLGYGVVELGGGRRRMDDPVDLRVGFLLEKSPGDEVVVGDILGEVHAANGNDLARGLQILGTAIKMSEEPPRPGGPLISQRVTASE